MTEMPDWHRDWMPELREGPPWLMQEMIEAEPALARDIARLDVAAVAELVRHAAASDAPIVITGCGTSEHAAQGIAEQLADALPATARVEARQAFESSLAPRAAGVCIAVSHDGGTHATIAAMRAASDAGATTAVITAMPGEAAAQAAGHALVTPLRDRSWCHTVGYLSPLLVGAAIASSLGGASLDEARASAAIAAGLDERAGAAAIAAGLHGARQIVAIGSGADLIAARELALKIEEGARLPSVARTLETMLHGHFAACDAVTGLVLIAADSRAAEARAERASALLRASRHIGIRCAAILSPAYDAAISPALTDAGRVVVTVDEPLAAPTAALLSTAAPLQLVTLELAHLAGCNPDLIGRDRAAWREAAALVEG